MLRGGVWSLVCKCAGPSEFTEQGFVNSVRYPELGAPPCAENLEVSREAHMPAHEV